MALSEVVVVNSEHGGFFQGRAFYVARGSGTKYHSTRDVHKKLRKPEPHCARLPVAENTPPKQPSNTTRNLHTFVCTILYPYVGNCTSEVCLFVCLFVCLSVIRGAEYSGMNSREYRTAGNIFFFSTIPSFLQKLKKTLLEKK